jgi:hypothetical protein
MPEGYIVSLRRRSCRSKHSLRNAKSSTRLHYARNLDLTFDEQMCDLAPLV